MVPDLKSRKKFGPSFVANSDQLTADKITGSRHNYNLLQLSQFGFKVAHKFWAVVCGKLNCRVANPAEVRIRIGTEGGLL